MIPYDDLVAALNAWRARQGLPVAASATPGSGPTPTAIPNTGSGGYATPSSGATARPGSGPVRSGPPSAPPRGSYQPPPLADTSDDSLDVDEAALLEEASYDNEGDDYAMNFGAVERDEESTTLGSAPERESFGGETELDRGSGKTRKPW
jgi:hypothetical protein